jgi:hypothetical protein
MIGDRRDPVTNARRALRRALDDLPNNLKLWRMVGEMAVKGAEASLRSRSGTAAQAMQDMQRRAAVLGATSASVAPPDPASVDVSVDVSVAPAPSAPTTLPIPDYDDLSASQVRERLAALDATQRAAIADHEGRHRRRTTILAAIERLDAATTDG